MKKIIALLLIAVINLSLCVISVGAVPAEDPIDLYAQDVIFTNSLSFSDPVIWYQTYSWMPSEDWDSAPMIFDHSNDFGEGMYYFNFPDDAAYRFYMSDGNASQRTETRTHQKNDTLELSLTGETDNNGYYRIKSRHVHSENLIVLDNTGNALSDDIYICCHCVDSSTGDDSNIRAKMELFDCNEYNEGRYRFTVPDGTQSFYFTDGKKRTAEMPFEREGWFYLPGNCDDEGNDEVFYVSWGGGPDDPVYSMGPSRTTFDRFCETYRYSTESFPRYDELYEHHDSSGKTDWILFYVEATGDPGMLAMYRDIIGNRVVDHGAYFDVPFPSYYGLYDATQDAFVQVDSSMTDAYVGLEEAFDAVGEGRLLGDLDGDDSITIIDATVIQRCEAQLRDYPWDDEMSGIRYQDHVIWYYSDFNRDGERDIVDATCIQRFLVGLR